MPQWAQTVVIAARLIAGCFGLLAFYFAFFLYESEDGSIQNALERLWIGLDDRSKLQNSRSVILLNRLGEFLKIRADAVFGKRLFSWRFVVASFAISLGSLLAILSLAGDDVDTIVGLILLVSMLYLLLSSSYRKLALAIFILSSLAAIFLLMMNWLLISLQILMIFVMAGLPNDPIWEMLLLVGASAVSIGFDLIGLLLVRKAYSTLAVSPSNVKLLGILIVMVFYAVISVLLPLYMLDADVGNSFFILPFIALGAMNVSTALYCLLPSAAILVLLIHRLIWPSLSRAIYPILNRKVITNKKLLFSVGTTCMSFAINFDFDKWKAILDRLR